MFFWDFLIVFPLDSFLDLVLKFQDFPEITREKGVKKVILRDFFFFRIKDFCHSFRYSFPLKTAGVIIMGDKKYLDCIFETKYRVKIRTFETRFFIGRPNLKKGYFVAISFPYKTEKSSHFPKIFASKMGRFFFDWKKNKNLKTKKSPYLTVSPIYKSQKKNSFSLCWSFSRISKVISIFFFDYFIKSKRKIHCFNKKNSKKLFFFRNFHIKSNKQFILRFDFHIFRSMVFPLSFPSYFSQKSGEKIKVGFILIFFSLGFFFRNRFFFSIDLLDLNQKNLGFCYKNFILQKKKEILESKIYFSLFSPRFFLSSFLENQLKKFPKIPGNFFLGVYEERGKKMFPFFKEGEITWNKKLNFSEAKLNFFSRKLAKHFSNQWEGLWFFLTNSLNCFFLKSFDNKNIKKIQKIEEKFKSIFIFQRYPFFFLSLKGYNNNKIDFFLKNAEENKKKYLWETKILRFFLQKKNL